MNGWAAIRGLIYIFGIENSIQLSILIAFLVVFILRKSRAYNAESDNRNSLGHRNIALTIVAPVLGFVLIIAINILKPSLTDRYFVPLIPSAILAMTLMTQRIGGAGLGGALLATSWLVPQLNLSAVHDKADARTAYNSEEGSGFIRQHKPDRLLFVWDHPLAKIMERRSLEQLGGYFLKRAGADIPVHAIIIPPSRDANAVLRSAAIGGRPAMIWLFNKTANSTAATYPPSFVSDPAWECLNRRSQKAADLASIACVKREPSDG